MTLHKERPGFAGRVPQMPLAEMSAKVDFHDLIFTIANHYDIADFLSAHKGKPFAVF